MTKKTLLQEMENLISDTKTRQLALIRDAQDAQVKAALVEEYVWKLEKLEESMKQVELPRTAIDTNADMMNALEVIKTVSVAPHHEEALAVIAKIARNTLGKVEEDMNQ